jgi:hypothetical protein
LQVTKCLIFFQEYTSAITVDPSTDYFDIDSIREIGGVLSKSPTGITKTQANTLGDFKTRYSDGR